jgi:hypothetical protein
MEEEMARVAEEAAAAAVFDLEGHWEHAGLVCGGDRSFSFDIGV